MNGAVLINLRLRARCATRSIVYPHQIRFIKDYCPVLEFGPVSQTMHAVDQCVPVAELAALTAVYRKIIEKYFE